MPVDSSKLVDPDYLADDDVRSIKTEDIRSALYRVCEQLKRVMNSQQTMLIQIQASINDIEARLSALEP